ncbi:MAG: hypothetical protein QRY16_21905, partial [Enterobacterales bacterium endosymbiont of Blomia tropicalis]|uniref:hypothetical protein n=1 Tax=Mixta mediterraneensis TaxID=2758443 RepID=UPI0025A73515
MSKDLIRVTLRSIFLMLCIYGLTPLSEHPRQKNFPHAFTSHGYVFLTNISVGYAIMSSCLGIVYRISKWPFSLFNLSLATSSSISMFVSFFFWLFFFYDRKLLENPKQLANNCATPLFTNICTHLAPFLLTLVEQWDIRLKRSKAHIFFLLVFDILYFCVIILCKNITGKYPYPFMRHLNMPLLILFFMGMATLK